MKNNLLAFFLLRDAATLTALAAFFSVLPLSFVFPGLRASFFFAIYLLVLVATLLSLLLSLFIGLFHALSTSDGTKRLHAQRKVALSLFGGLEFMLFLGAIAFLPIPLPTGSELSKFEAKVWLAPHSTDSVEDQPTPRQRMLADVIDNVLPGKSEEQIAAILGPPLEASRLITKGRGMIYVLGPVRDAYFRVGPEWLIIRLDSDGKYRKFEILTD